MSFSWKTKAREIQAKGGSSSTNHTYGGHWLQGAEIQSEAQATKGGLGYSTMGCTRRGSLHHFLYNAYVSYGLLTFVKFEPLFFILLFNEVPCNLTKKNHTIGFIEKIFEHWKLLIGE